MTLWRVALRARGEDVEVTRVELLELVPAGIEERALPDGAVELAAYVDEPQRSSAARPLRRRASGAGR